MWKFLIFFPSNIPCSNFCLTILIHPIHTYTKFDNLFVTNTYVFFFFVLVHENILHLLTMEIRWSKAWPRFIVSQSTRTEFEQLFIHFSTISGLIGDSNEIFNCAITLAKSMPITDNNAVFDYRYCSIKVSRNFSFYNFVENNNVISEKSDSCRLFFFDKYHR